MVSGLGLGLGLGLIIVLTYDVLLVWYLVLKDKQLDLDVPGRIIHHLVNEILMWMLILFFLFESFEIKCRVIHNLFYLDKFPKFFVVLGL